MKEEIIKSIITFILSLISIITSYVLAKLGEFLKEKKNKITVEKGIDNYNRGLNIARGMYLTLESEFKDIAKSGMIKKSEMDRRLLKVIPELSQEELDSINKIICEEFQKNTIDILMNNEDK